MLFSLNTVSHDEIQEKNLLNGLCLQISSGTMFEHEESNRLIMHEESFWLI